MDVIRQNEDWLSGYVSEPDKGAADAINKGLEKCTGDIIAWLNADDFYLPGALEEVAKLTKPIQKRASGLAMAFVPMKMVTKLRSLIKTACVTIIKLLSVAWIIFCSRRHS